MPYQARKVSGHVLVTLILLLSMILIFDFGIVPTVWYFVFHLIKTVELSECGKIMSLQ